MERSINSVDELLLDYLGFDVDNAAAQTDDEIRQGLNSLLDDNAWTTEPFTREETIARAVEMAAERRRQ